jgi:hypothetical protein
MGKDIIWGVYALLAVTGVRWIWLIILLRRYAEIKISADFMREHFYLGLPLVITTLISGSAQYIDGISSPQSTAIRDGSHGSGTGPRSSRWRSCSPMD